MSRGSGDELAADGSILNGFDYELQVWVQNGVCLAVGAGARFVGQQVASVEGHEVRVIPSEDCVHRRQNRRR